MKADEAKSYVIRTVAGLCLVTEMYGAVVKAAFIDENTINEPCMVYDHFPTTIVRPEGTAFQQNVWKHLLDVPMGCCITYADLAQRCGCPKAVRAVATAVGRNPIAVLIPCHRIVPASGGIGNYRYGSLRKRLLLEAEGCEV